MTIYICLSFLTLVISSFVFYPHIVISPLSALPVVLFLLSVLEIFLLKEQQDQSIDDYRLNNTAYSFRELDLSKINCSKKWLQRFKIISLPVFLFFALYFNGTIKCLFSLFIFVFTYILTRIFVVAENRINTNKRS